MNIRLQTEICQLFNIRYPILLAGMAGGPTTAELVAAVSNAGGLGTLGAGYMTPVEIRETIRKIRKLTAASFAVNLFSIRITDDHSRMAEVQRVLNRMRDDLGLPPATEDLVKSVDLFEEQFRVLMEEQVPIISATFGLLPEPLLQEAKSSGMRIVAMVTTVREAILAERSGCDAIVAQGSEAGGHRGTFEPLHQSMGANIGTLALVPQVADRVKIPVIAAGGIMDGRGLVAALVLGAQGVQMGTKFLTSMESGAHPAYARALLESTEESTVLTKVFSGRPARAVKNKFIQIWDEKGVEPLLYPTQNTVTRDIRNAAARQNHTEYMSLWAGQGTRMLTSGQRAKDIIC